MKEDDLQKAFAAVESNDLRVTHVAIGGSLRQQRRTLRDLKEWNKKVEKP